MSLRQRLSKLQNRTAPTTETDIIIIARFAATPPGASKGRPGFAHFIGFPKEQLQAEDHETCEQFEARCENYLVELRRRRLASTDAPHAAQKGQHDGNV